MNYYVFGQNFRIETNVLFDRSIKNLVFLFDIGMKDEEDIQKVKYVLPQEYEDFNCLDVIQKFTRAYENMSLIFEPQFHIILHPYFESVESIVESSKEENFNGHEYFLIYSQKLQFHEEAIIHRHQQQTRSRLLQNQDNRSS